MKANELFPGSLVRVNRDGLCIKKDTIVEVRAVDADDKLPEKGLVGAAHCRPLDDDQFDGGIWCEYLDPIPLTAEILEKNGFTRFGTDYILKEMHFGLENPSIPSNYLDNYWLRVSIKAVHIEYVHQIQNALRLCGIDKEIEL